jgi:hypothetical protein
VTEKKEKGEFKITAKKAKRMMEKIFELEKEVKSLKGKSAPKKEEREEKETPEKEEKTEKEAPKKKTFIQRILGD